MKTTSKYFNSSDISNRATSYLKKIEVDPFEYLFDETDQNTDNLDFSQCLGSIEDITVDRNYIREINIPKIEKTKINKINQKRKKPNPLLIKSRRIETIKHY